MTLSDELSALATELSIATTQQEALDTFAKIITSPAYRRLSVPGRDWLREHVGKTVARLPRYGD